MPVSPEPENGLFSSTFLPTATAIPITKMNASPAPPLPASSFQNRLHVEGEAYIFEFQQGQTKLRYHYIPQTGSLHDLTVQIGEGAPFYPSNYGGPRFLVSGQDIPIWETDPEQYAYQARIIDGITLEVKWQARFSAQTIPYTYRFTLQGKTLIIEVEAPGTDISAFTLDRSEATPDAELIAVPYLPFFHLLRVQDHFLSAFFDWQLTSASTLEKMGEVISEQSLAFSQTAYYHPNTAGERQPLHEVIYLTVSDRLDEVLPSLPAEPSPSAGELAGKVVLDLWAERPFAEDAQLLQALSARGIADLIVIRHNWQRCGFDDCYPNVLPANPRWGGDAALLELSQAAQQAGYRFALHENYVDLYPNSEFFSPEWLALGPEGSPIEAWFNRTTGVQSYLLSPTRSLEVAQQFAPEIHRRYQTTASYLDVSTAVNPAEKVDYNAAIAGNARFATPWRAYQQLLAYQRQAHQGPVLGEGGHHFLYVGQVDGVLAEDAGREQAGASLPPLVHFDLLRIHPKMVRFGMGFYPWYFAQGEQLKWTDYNLEEHYRYMANEIAYCHGGYIPTPDSLGEFEEVLAFIEREVRLVAPIHQRCALAYPLRILYHLNGELIEVEQALGAEAIWQIFVEYANGLQVWVNLHPTENWPVELPWTPTWVDYSALVDGRRQDGVGKESRRAYLLPPNGWVAAQP
ncbi:MAG: DUF5696 domain-containing protein [Anaerolineales bacterium]|nr:DUF5696 domain-containing protein [Anaerolineales bacterium]MDW8163052.1 DUF5696 domain-containing protein [Anaerolineales bacterium]